MGALFRPSGLLPLQSALSAAYAQAALNQELAKVAGTTFGRNQQLYASSFSLGQLIGAGLLDRHTVEQTLFQAAEACGYVAKDGRTAALATIKNGLDRGERHPRTIRAQHRATEQVALIRHEPVFSAPSTKDDAARISKAQWLWARRQPLDDRYLRQARGLRGPFPTTLGFLLAQGSYSPSMIAAFGLASEPEPGLLAIAERDVMAVHLTKLKPDGSGKADVQPNKIMIGRPKGSPIMLAPPNDLLGMCISEGIEDALSVNEGTGLGAWAAGSASLMPALADVVPEYVDFVSILAHRDPAGIRSANELATRLRTRGISCAVAFLGTEMAA
jgi:hypothetical protein